MKKTQFIEWGIIILGLIFGYKFFESVFSLLFQLIYQPEQTDRYIWRFLLILVLYGAAFIVLIRNSHKVAEWLNPLSASNDAVPLRISMHSLLQVVLITICAATILSNISGIILYIYDLIKNDVSGRRFKGDYAGLPGKFGFQSAVVQSLVALLVICFSKNIAGWFIRKQGPEELLLESPTETNPESPTETDKDVHE